MTDPQTPATEAGGWLLSLVDATDMWDQAYSDGRADALREAADALDAVPYAPRLGFINRKRAKAAVLAILDPETTP